MKLSKTTSLHAPTQELRTRIVPSAKAWPLPKLMEVLDERLRQVDLKVMIEYILIGGVNDSIETAHQLGQLLQGKYVHVNLIPYNPTDVAEHFVPPTPESIDQFHSIVRQHGISCSVRRTMGQEISGACGQLVVKQKQTSQPMKDIEDLYSSSRPTPKNKPLPKSKQKSKTETSGRKKNILFYAFLFGGLVLIVFLLLLYHSSFGKHLKFGII